MSDNKSIQHYFHFSLAPVQSFIAQARRTRDFWAGSFLLSWLSAVAMRAVEAQGGEIVFPQPDPDFLLWLTDAPNKSDRPPQHGSVPNRFMAHVDGGRFEPETVVACVQSAWQALADLIYAEDFKDIGNATTRAIWEAQVARFWEIHWVLTADANDSAALDVRKNWRSHIAPEQPGVKCMMLEGWQELSGASAPGAAVTAFWDKLREQKLKAIKTDLRPDEHLCAIAFIKRRFPRYFHALQADLPGAWRLHGWPVKPGRPSVAYMAAVHWLEQVFIQATNQPDITEKLWRFHDAAYRLTDGQHNEWDNQIYCLSQCDVHHKWKSLDGNVFFDSQLENANLYEDRKQAEQVREELKALQGSVNDHLHAQGKAQLPPPTPFYAVLMMDGDGLGKQMGDSAKHGAIADALHSFTHSVPELVERHSGFLVYAGGDDVLAVLPLEDALSCALELRQKYTKVFETCNASKPEAKQVFTSISAALLYAHIKTPLTKVLKTVHALLDQVAKEEYGRDSLAVSVWKPGGQTLQWARPWERAIENNGLVIERLVEAFKNDDHDGQMSNRFLYKIRERFDMLNPPPGKDGAMPLSDSEAIDLLAAEYIASDLCKSFKTSAEKLARARSVVTPLLQQCQPLYRKVDRHNKVSFDEPAPKRLADDAAMLVRFLAQKGVD